MPDINQRLRNQTRPVWDASVADSGNSLNYINVSAANGSTLVIPSGATGLTLCIRHETDPRDVFLYPLGGLVGVCTADNAGTILSDGAKDFTALGVLVGDRVINVTDGSFGLVTVVGVTTVTHGALSGGTNDDWERILDTYRIERASEPRIVIRGDLSSVERASLYFALDNSWAGAAKAMYLRSVDDLQDVVVFYHFD